MSNIQENPLRMKVTIEHHYPRYVQNDNSSKNIREFSICFRYTRLVEELLYKLEELTKYDESKELKNLLNEEKRNG